MLARPGISTELMKKGFSFICAHCKKMFEARARNSYKCAIESSDKMCCGPFSNEPNVFPLYEGELTGSFVNFCFWCGERPVAAIDIYGKGFLGVCKDHIEELDKVGPEGSKPRFVTRKTLPLING